MSFIQKIFIAIEFHIFVIEFFASAETTFDELIDLSYEKRRMVQFKAWISQHIVHATQRSFK